MPNPLTALKALRELGFEPVALNVLYKLGLKTGYFRALEDQKQAQKPFPLHFPFTFPTRQALLTILGRDGLQQLRAEADEIVGGKFRQFGGPPVEIRLAPPSAGQHWTRLETTPQHLSDIKLTWEPARFGWAFTLGRAFHASGDEKYAAAFWDYFETFQAANPPYFGENWTSGQEIGLRLMAFAWAGQVFRQAQQTTPARLAALAAAIDRHATRIPATLLYARSQNNNHLLTEAAALYTAALALPDHPSAAHWRALGQKWLVWCFEHQIDPSGEYVQHSTNYHRLMLQTALWVKSLKPTQAQLAGQLNASITNKKPLARATHWLISLLDPFSGQTCNLGHNDGAYIFPLTTCPYSDYRPVAQAAWLAFWGSRPFEAGPWDEMALWFGIYPVEFDDYKLAFDTTLAESRRLVFMRNAPPINVTASPSGLSWAHLRTANFSSRPGHADLLHLDLWWRGINLTLDPGTFQYNAAPPWDNALTHARHHNTVTIDSADQFTRAGRFLYLDFSQVRCVSFPASSDRLNEWQTLVAKHTAWGPRFGIGHHRQVNIDRSETWTVHDTLQFAYSGEQHTIRLHWLFPDWEWELEQHPAQASLRLKSPQGWVTVQVQATRTDLPTAISLVRAGENLYGERPAQATDGWYSPTYGTRIPALSLALEVKASDSVEFFTTFGLPEANDDRVRLEAIAAQLETFAAQLRTLRPEANPPEDPGEVLEMLIPVIRDLRSGKLGALEDYRYYGLSPWEWRDSLGPETEQLLEQIDAAIWHFRLY